MRRRSEQLHEIVFYKDRNGNEPVYEYMSELAKSNSKDSRVKLKKIREYIKALSANGHCCRKTM